MFEDNSRVSCRRDSGGYALTTAWVLHDGVRYVLLQYIDDDGALVVPNKYHVAVQEGESDNTTCDDDPSSTFFKKLINFMTTTASRDRLDARILAGTAESGLAAISRQPHTVARRGDPNRAASMCIMGINAILAAGIYADFNAKAESRDSAYYSILQLPSAGGESYFASAASMSCSNVCWSTAPEMSWPFTKVAGCQTRLLRGRLPCRRQPRSCTFRSKHSVNLLTFMPSVPATSA